MDNTTKNSADKGKSNINITKKGFAVDKNIIYPLIQAQAGTLSKAFLEYIMNSVDAGATSVSIDLANNSFVYNDNGKGFVNEKEIEDWFDVFGFPHDDDKTKRTYGQFGIGRAQMWSFASTVWKTHNFIMDVDIKNKGLSYDFTKSKSKINGVNIEGTFYEPLLPSDILSCERDLAELAKYAQIPVYLNGKQINLIPQKEKWDFETDEAWIKIKDEGDLSVYNLGVLVRRYSSFQFGCGGTVVTKPNVKLELNMARNDVLVSKCQVWKKIKPFLQKKSEEKMMKKPSLSMNERINVFHRLLSGDITYRELENLKFITDFSKKHLTLQQFASNRLPLTSSEDGSLIADKLNQDKLAFILPNSLLNFLGVSSPQELLTKINNGISIMQSKDYSIALGCISNNIKSKKIIDFKTATQHISNGHTILNDKKDLTLEEKCILKAIREHADEIAYAVYRLSESKEISYRKIKAGVSDIAQAWTDGKDYVAINKPQLNEGRKGLSGFNYLVLLLVHEYIHDDNDTSSHVHDFDFYETYHKIVCNPNLIHDISEKMFSKYIKFMKEEGLDKKLLKSAIASSDKVHISSTI